MSFLQQKKMIEEGDTVILYITPQCMYPVTVKPTKLNKKNENIENVFQTSFGCIKVESLIGKLYGSKVPLIKGSNKGWAHALHPTPELWTSTLPHRTQIIYTPDISMILFQLDLRPGSVVIEAGTGSGSLTHSLARVVYPSGHVYSFDFHETRVAIAKTEFQSHGLSEIVSVEQRDVCSNGYGENLECIADAIFLDLPLPWEAIPHAAKCIKTSGGRLVSFSPCIEQVQKTSELLRALCFTDVNTVECLQREFTVAHRTLYKLSLNSDSEHAENQEEKFLACMAPMTMPGHTGYLTSATLPPKLWRTNATVSSRTDPKENDGVD